ncbi:MAG: ABC transporter ATP-binding protein [Pelagibacteraceae bacterium]|jgi:subfamily B ATP-binding cassette protein MsbA|nr:ABC transporter ATP-binding protein [Pelagibacteraceae bacterium]|tara:strand:- start:4855 stop:6591 length:1737 start_codon:yes stop_codon:yes gene_type:complete
MTDKEIIKRLYNNYINKYLNKFFFALFLSLLVAGSTAAIAWLLDPAIKKIFVEKNTDFLLLIPITIILAFTIKGISIYLVRTMMIKVGASIEKEIQQNLLESIINSDTQVIEKKHSGKFIGNLTFDAALIIQLVSSSVLSLIKDSLTLIALLSLMFYQNWRLSLFAIIMIPLATITSKSLGKRMGKITAELQIKIGMITSYFLEILKNSKIIKTYQKEQFEFARADKFLEEAKEKGQKMGIILVRSTPIMEVLTGLMIAGLIYYSARMVHSGTLEINNFFSFLAAMMLSYQPVRALATLNIGIKQGLAGARRVYEVIDLKRKIDENINAKDLVIDKAKIEYKDVSFAYDDDKEILKSINLKIEGGNIIALIGHSGAGKTTIMNLIPRFYNASSGEILIDNQSIRKVTLFSLRKNISLVSQDITLFDDTVLSNIAYANSDASKEKILEASKFSAAHDFVERLPEKYDTLIGENGVRLSGGEKQRISIARAILKDAPIILLDEATSSLDADTEHKIQEAIMYLTKNKTTIIIAHRLSTVLRANKIFIIENGKVVAEGNHDYLLKNSKIYKNFYNKQLRPH